MRRVPLLPAAVLAWIAAILAVLLPAAAAAVAIALWSMAFAGLVAAARTTGQGRRTRTGALCAVFAVGMAAAAAVASHVALAQPGRTVAAELGVEGGRAITVTAVVTSKVTPAAGGNLWFDAEASLLQAGPHDATAAVPVAVSVSPDDVAGGVLDLGAQVSVRGTARRADAGERAVLVVFASRGVDIVREPAGALAISSALRSAFVRLAADLPGDGGALLPGLAVGETSAVGAELDQAMKASSLSHLTAVSGANCAIIVGLAFGAAALVGARRGVRVAVALVALGAFIVLVTPEPSVVRAGAMATAGMLGVLLGRRPAGAASLCLAIVVLLISDPWLALSLGFALSAAATAALLVIAPPLARGLARVMPKAVALALAIPLSAQLVCGPLLVLVNPVLPLYGVLANLVAGPAAPAATVLGLLACVVHPVLPVLAAGVAAIAWVPSAWIAATAATVSELPAASVPWAEGWWGAVALGLLGGCVLVLLVRARGRRTTALRITAGAVLAMSVGAIAGAAALVGPAGPLTVPSAWMIAACDVGQGDAVLVRSHGRVALIDTGPDPGALQACLTRLGVSHLDLAILTHFDLDHVGGTDAIAGIVDTVVHGPPGDTEDEELLGRLERGGAVLHEGTAGMTGTLGGAHWRVLWPPGGSVAFPAGNDASVVAEFRGGDVPVSIFLGDLSASPQAILAGSGRLSPPYDVVKVAHHGSADQDAGLYRLLRPAVAVVSAGVDNDYGHPRAETLRLLAAVGSVIARTDRDGLVMLGLDHGDVAVWRERAPP